MAQLDASTTTSASVAQHLSDHNQLHAKANYVFDVTDYGADGDDVSDDTSAVQDAIDAAEAAGGGIVYFPPGTYRITSVTIDDSSVTLKGDGNGRFSPVTLRTSAADSTSMIVLDGADRVRIEGIWFRSFNSAWTGNFIDGATNTASLHVFIEKCTFFGGTNHTAIKIGPTSYSWIIRDCEFHYGAYAIVGDHTGSEASIVSIDNCFFADNIATAQILNPSCWKITNNIVEPLTGGAPGFIALSSYAPYNVVVTGNWIGDVTAAGTCIEVAGKAWHIAGNLIHCGTAGIGIDVVDDTSGLSMMGNRFYGSGTSIRYGGSLTITNVSGYGNDLDSTSTSGSTPAGTNWQS